MVFGEGLHEDSNMKQKTRLIPNEESVLIISKKKSTQKYWKMSETGEKYESPRMKGLHIRGSVLGDILWDSE